MKKLVFMMLSLLLVKQNFGASDAPAIKEENRLFVQDRQIILISEKDSVNREELAKAYPNKFIIACDFYISGCERWIEIPGGYSLGSLISVDHHAPVTRMAKEITATSFAVEFVRAHPIIPKDAIILINHTDCDSILSSLIIAGAIPPIQIFADASRAADHTGIENPIADLLQGIQRKRDISFSLRNLIKLLDENELDQEAKHLLLKRHQDRAEAKKCIDQGHFKQQGFVAFACLTQKIDTALLPALLPNAAVIAIACPMVNDPSRLEIAVRRGLAAPAGLFINKLGLPDGFGGRWNCGSNKRGGGTTKSVDEYVTIVNDKIEEFLQNTKK